MDVNIIVALITAFITVSGWIVSNYLLRKNEDRTKRLQLNRDYTSKQIEELYGPLYSLINQIFVYWEIQERITRSSIIEEDKIRIESFMREKYYSRIHQEIKELLKTKFHLIKGVELPDSYWAYLQHSTQESMQRDIYDALKIDTSKIEGFPWPDNFNTDVKSDLDSLMIYYDKLLKELK